MNINDILSSVLQSTQASNQRLTGIADMQGQLAAENAATSAANTAQARADIPVAQGLAGQQAGVQAQQSQLIQQLQAQANLNPADADNAYVRGLADLTATNTQREQAHAQMTKLATTDLFDDPIGFVMAQLQLPVAQAQAQALDQQAARQVQDVQTRLSLVNNAKSTLTADTVQQVKQIQLSAAELKANEATRALSQQEMENKSRIAGQYLQQAQTLDKMNDNIRQVYTMQMQAAQYNETMAARAEARAERNMMMQERIAAKKTQEGEDAMLTAGLSAASAILGYPQPVSVEFFKRMPNGKQKQALATLAANNSLGDNLLEAFTNFGEGKGTVAGLQRGGNTGLAKFMSGIDQTVDAYILDAGKPDKLGKTPSAKEAAVAGVQNYERALVDSSANPKTTRPLTHPEWDSKFTPYRQHFGLVSNAVTAGRAPLAGNAMYDALKVIASNATTPDGNVSGEGEQTALRTVAQRVANRELNENDAAKQIVQYYRVAAAVNRDVYQYGVMGLPPQDSYMGSVKVPGAFGTTSTTKNYNLMNETQAKMLVMEIAKQSAPDTPGLGALRTLAPGITAGTEALFKWAK